MTAALPELLRVPDLAAVLGLSENAVRDLLARGAIPACKVGRRWVVRRGALLASLRAAEREHRRSLARPAPRAASPTSDLARIALAAR